MLKLETSGRIDTRHQEAARLEAARQERDTSERLAFGKHPQSSSVHILRAQEVATCQVVVVVGQEVAVAH